MFLIKKKFKKILFLGAGAFFVLSAGSSWAWRDSLLSMVDPYQKVLAKYTRREIGLSLNQVDTDYRWYATYHSPELLAAVDKELLKFYPHGLSPYAQELRAEMESPGQTDIFVAMYAKSRELRKLLGQKNLWQVKLIAGSQEMIPVMVEEIEINPMHHKLYPYLSKYYKGYRLVFPFQSAAPDGFELEISGPLGSHRVKFAER